MNEMLKTMLARGPGPGAGHTDAERKLQDKINDAHNLQLQYNRGKEEIESWIRKKKEVQQQIHDLNQQKKDVKNQIKDQAERQKAVVNRFKAGVTGEDKNVQF